MKWIPNNESYKGHIENFFENTSSQGFHSLWGTHGRLNSDSEGLQAPEENYFAHKSYFKDEVMFIATYTHYTDNKRVFDELPTTNLLGYYRK